MGWARSLAWIAGAVVLGLSAVASAVPGEVPYVGSLTFGDGAPYSGPPVTVEAALYPAATGAAPLWGPYSFGAVAVNDGVFSIVLGAAPTQPIDPALLMAEGLWLELTIDSAPMLPRQRVLSVPYALLALESERLGGLEAAWYAVKPSEDAELAPVAWSGNFEDLAGAPPSLSWTKQEVVLLPGATAQVSAGAAADDLAVTVWERPNAGEPWTLSTPQVGFEQSVVDGATGQPLDVGEGSAGPLVLSGDQVYFIEDLVPGYDPVTAIPSFTDVTVTGGAILAVKPYAAATGKGGILRMRATGKVVVGAGSAITADAAGFPGGQPSAGANTAGNPGQGPGAGAAGCSNNVGCTPRYPAGGGGFAQKGGDGVSMDDMVSQPTPKPNTGGPAYGAADLSGQVLGSGGGSGGNDTDSGVQGIGGKGGAGGGAVRIVAGTIEVAPGGRVSADGQAGTKSNYTSVTGEPTAGGGGSGGSVHLRAQAVTINGTVTAKGGAGADQSGETNLESQKGHAGIAGSGSPGRIRIDAQDLAGSTTPASGFSGVLLSTFKQVIQGIRTRQIAPGTVEVTNLGAAPVEVKVILSALQ